jgi:serine/threonine-protein kinase
VIRGVLGRGGSPTVYEADDVESGGHSALMVLPPAPDHRDAERERMLREARLLGAVRHEGIVRVRDGGLLDGGRAYLVMERLDGRTLADRMEECFWLPLDEALGIAGQLLEALEAAHAAGVIHRDVKPSNVFLARGGGRLRTKLIDFGIGVDLGDPAGRLTAPGVVVGTLGYMAPEQLFGDEPTARSDVYAAGATMYEMLAGRRPFAIETGDVRSVLRAMSGAVEPLASIRPSIPAPLAEGVMRALARRPADRHASCRAMRDACLSMAA